MNPKLNQMLSLCQAIPIRIQNKKSHILGLKNVIPDLVAEIEKYQAENYISSFAGAVYELIRKGLQVSDNRDR